MAGASAASNLVFGVIITRWLVHHGMHVYFTYRESGGLRDHAPLCASQSSHLMSPPPALLGCISQPSTASFFSIFIPLLYLQVDFPKVDCRLRLGFHFMKYSDSEMTRFDFQPCPLGLAPRKWNSAPREKMPKEK